MVLLRFNGIEKVWDIIQKEEKEEGDLYLDGNLRKCLDYYKKQQGKDNDVVLILVGDEGSGKSSLMGNILEYMSNGEFDPKLHLIGSNYLDALEKIENAPQKGYIGFDEAVSFLLSTETMKKEHRDFHKIFSIFRQKNLFVVLCLPSFFRLGNYFALDRSDGLLRTYLKNGQRSFFTFHGKKLKDKLYRVGKKDYNEFAVKPTFRGRFSRCIKLENVEYKAFKGITLSSEIAKAKDGVKKPKTEYEIKKLRDLEVIKKHMETPNTEIANILGLTARRIRQIKQQIREDVSS